MAIVATKLATIDEAITEIVEKIVEAHVSIDQAVRDWFATRSLDPVGLQEAARVGLAKLVANALHQSRGLSEATEDERPQVRSGRNAWVNRRRSDQMLYARLYRTYYEAADARQKPLAFFTRDDWEALRARFTAQVSAAMRRVDMCDRALALLDKHGVDLADELPEDAKHELDAVIAEAQA
jgi:hypothetical protein